MNTAATLIIGIGNEQRGDDAAGLLVVRRIGELQTAGTFPSADVHESSGDATELLDLWQDAGRVVLVDALHSGGAPGTTVRFDAAVQALPAGLSHASTHTLGLAEAVALARTLGHLPAHLIVYAIEGANFAIGAALSPAIAAAVESTVACIRNDA